MSDEIKTQAVEIVKTILDKMGFNADVNFLSDESGQKPYISLSLSVPTDSGFLIGKNGNNLEALEHLLKAIVNKKINTQPRINFILDINDYRKLRTTQLAELAKTIADRVAQTSRAEALQPMTSYERRVVHMELASYGRIATESIGEEPNRRIVVKPLH